MHQLIVSVNVMQTYQYIYPNFETILVFCSHFLQALYITKHYILLALYLPATFTAHVGSYLITNTTRRANFRCFMSFIDNTRLICLFTSH